MRMTFTAILAGMVLLGSVMGSTRLSVAYELPQKPCDPVAAYDLRSAPEAYTREWIERTNAVYIDGQTGSLAVAYVYLTGFIFLLLATLILIGARLNGLDRHLRSFSNNQFKTALQLWMFRRWGSRV
jgi:hypothetical protein